MAQESIRQLWMGLETTAGVCASYLRAIPYVDFKGTPKDVRIVPKENMGSLIKARRAVRAKKSGEITLKTYAYFDVIGWLLAGVVNNTVASTIKSSPTGNSDSQIVTFSSAPAWAAGDTYILRINGYTTEPIALANSGATAVLNAQRQVSILPSVMASANCTITGDSTAITLPYSGTLQKTLMPLALATPLTTSNSGATISVDHSTGVGVYDHYWKGGTSGRPTATIVHFDGVSYKVYQGCYIDTMDFTFSVDKPVEIDIKAISKMPVDFGTLRVFNPANSQLTNGTVNTTLTASVASGASAAIAVASSAGLVANKYVVINDSSSPYKIERTRILSVSTATPTTFYADLVNAHISGAPVTDMQLPAQILSSYNEAADPSQVSFSVNGSANTTLLSGKVSLKANREGLWTIGSGADLNRATDGEFEVTFDFQYDYTTTTGEFQNFLNNTAPGAIIFQITDTTSLGGTPTAYPTLKITLPNPIYNDGDIDPSKPSAVAQVKGTALLDPTTGTNIRIDVTNEQRSYAATYPTS